MKKLISILFTTVLWTFFASLALAGGEKPAIIRIGSAYGGGFGKPYSAGIIGIVHSQGLLEKEFEKDGIKIEWFFFKGAGPATNEAFANDTIDFGYQGDLPSIIGRAGGLKTKIIAAGSERANVYIVVPNDSSIKSVKELKGKKVGIFKGTNASLAFARILTANGLTERDLNLYNLNLPDGQAALTTKDIDAGVYWNNMLNLRTLGVVKIIYSTKEAPDDWKNTGSLLVTQEFANKYPDIVKRVIKVYLQAAKWGSEENNREEVLKLWAKIGIPYSSYQEEYKGLPANVINTPLLDPFFYNHYKGGVSYSKENNLIRNTFDVDTWIDKSYLEAGLKELALENFWPKFGADGKEIK